MGQPRTNGRFARELALAIDAGCEVRLNTQAENRQITEQTS